MDVYEVVSKLVGPVAPTGDSEVDRERLHNLEGLMYVVGTAIDAIKHVSMLRNNHIGFVKHIGKRAEDFLIALEASLQEERPVSYKGSIKEDN